MLSLSDGQRQLLVDKLPDVANLAIGALFFGQFLSDRPFSIALALFGTGAWMALMSLAIAFVRTRT